MSDTRYSVMILPRRSDGAILLQSFDGDKGVVVDGFGSFYQAGEDPATIARQVFKESFNTSAQPKEVACLQYFISKPTGLVDLKITVFFIDALDTMSLQENTQWYLVDEVPYRQMHPATGKWLPLLLEGQVPLSARVKVDQPGDHTKGKVTDFTFK